MKMICFCRHRTAGWEGVVYEDDQGRHFVTNGLGNWELNESRRASLEEVSSIHLGELCECIEKYRSDPALLRILREAKAG